MSKLTETITWVPAKTPPTEEDWYLAYLVWPGDDPASGNVHMMKWMNNAGRWGWYAPFTTSPQREVTHWATRPDGPSHD